MYVIAKEEKEAVLRVLENGRLFRYGDAKAGHLQEVARFEKSFAEKIGVPYALAVTSGTAALSTALAGLGRWRSARCR